jgi:serine/threonine protein kinase
MSTEQALPLAQQIASALESAHNRGILHRDLKPANIIITDAGAKLLDFGLAKLATDADATRTTDGAVIGTAAYMSPEQARGKPVDARSDIFSFGAVLYEMVSGRRAFGGASLLETLYEVVEANPAALDSPLFSVIRRCLAKDASHRFPNAVELKAALAGSSPTRSEPSIAVLPFINMSRDAFAYAPASPFVVGVLAGALMRTGAADRSRALLDALPGHSSEASIAYTLYHFVLGDIDSAVERAGEALEQRNFMLISNFLRPFEGRLSKSPAWPGALAKAGLSPAPP